MITNVIEEGNIEFLNITSPFHLESTPNEVLAEQISPLFSSDMNMNSDWDLVWKNVTKVVNIKSYKSSSKISKTILSNSCGYCKSGELLALVGTSGSGKTSLLQILAGRTRSKPLGEVYINGYKYSSDMRRKISFILQEDLVRCSLSYTVRDHLNF